MIANLLLDIEHAHQILRNAPRPVVRIDVEAWARLYGMDGDPRAPVSVGPDFDLVHALTGTDLRRPLILAEVPLAGGGTIELICDGSHRLFRGFVEGLEHLPAYQLTAAETREIICPLPRGDTFGSAR